MDITSTCAEERPPVSLHIYWFFEVWDGDAPYREVAFQFYSKIRKRPISSSVTKKRLQIIEKNAELLLEKWPKDTKRPF